MIAADGRPRAWEAERRDLRRVDVEVAWWTHRTAVVSAFRNFAALRFIRLPVESAAERVIEKPLRDLVDAVGRQRHLSVAQRRHVYHGALLALAGLPLGMGLPSPFGIIDEIDRLVAGSADVATALQDVWVTVDDARFWTSVGRQLRYSPAV